MALVANPSADLYGSDRMMLETVRGLVAADWEVLVAASASGPLASLVKDAGARFVVVPAPVLRRSNLSIGGLARLGLDVVRGIGPLLRLVRTVRPDVLYVSTLTIPLWLFVGRLSRVPVVNHLHEAESSVHPVARLGLTLPTRMAHVVICNSAETRRVARASGASQTRTVVIYNGVAGPPVVCPPRDGISAPRLLYVGRLSPRKGVDIAIETLAQLHDAGMAATLDLVGDVFPGYEGYREQLHVQVARHGLEGFVRFVGFCDDVWPSLAAADIVLVPSRAEESFGNVVVEAALSARPVVVSDHSGLREAAGGMAGARLVSSADPTAMAHAVRTFVDNWKHARQLALEDSGHIAAAFGTERYRRQMVAVLKGLVEDHPCECLR